MGHNSDSVELQYCNIDGSEQCSAVADVPPTAAGRRTVNRQEGSQQACSQWLM